MVTGVVRVGVYLRLVQALGSSPPQDHFVWVPDQRACVVSDVDSAQLALTVVLITDVLLLSIVLVGLVRFRQVGGGSIGLQGLLWRQVRCCQFPTAAVLSAHQCVSFVRELLGSCLPL